MQTRGLLHEELSLAERALPLVVVAFDQHAPQQSPDTVNGMAVAGGLIPAVIFLIVMLIMAGYPLTEAKFKDIMKSIEANRSLRHEQLHPGEVPAPAGTRTTAPAPRPGIPTP